ncbi:MAG TPA: hypothetical protein VGC53_14570 [Vicinamibacteria bacterium]
MSRQPRCTLPRVALVLSFLSAPVFGETPRTPWGDPDLQGMWVNNSATPLERPDAFQGKETLTDEELQELKRQAAEVLDGGDAFFADDFVTAAVEEGTAFRSFDQKTGNYNQFWIVEREFDNRTSLIVDPPDGRIPPLTPEGRKRRAKEARGFLGIDPAGPEDLSNQVRCITYPVPNVLAGYNSFFHILQTPQYVVIFQELIHDARIIPMDGRPHLPENIRQWHGDPRGRWDGDTLVVESTNFSPKSNFRGSAENLHLVERFTRIDAEMIVYEITIDDPTTFARAWTIQIPLKSSPDPIFEYACHEGNVAMEGILKGARAEERNQPK